MVDAFYAWLAALAVLLALAALAARRRASRFDGVWLGVPAFLADAGLSEAQLFVDGADGYLYMVDAAGGVVADAPARVGATWGGRLSVGHPLFPEPLCYELDGGLLKAYLPRAGLAPEVMLYLWRDPVASLEAKPLEAKRPPGPKPLEA